MSSSTVLVIVDKELVLIKINPTNIIEINIKYKI